MKKFLAIILPLLLLLAGCAPSLSRGATATLTVQSVTPDYTVTASYGELTRQGDLYTLSLSSIRDVLFTVSAEGYETVNVRVTKDDFLQGDTARTAVLDTPHLMEVRITLTGRTENASVQCADVQFTSLGENAFIGNVTAAQLSQGIVATAEHAEPRTFFFEQSAYRETFLEQNLHLVKEGTKCVQLLGLALNSAYILDDDAHLLESFSDGKNGCYVEVPRAYKGGLHIRIVTGYAVNFVPCDDQVYYLSDNELPYSGEVFGSLPAVETQLNTLYLPVDSFIEAAQAAEVLDDRPDSDFSTAMRLLWVETDKVLCRCTDHPDGGMGASVNAGGIDYHILRLPKEEQLLHLFVGTPFRRHAKIDIERRGEYLSAEDLTVTVEEGMSADGIWLDVRDSVTGEQYLGDVLCNGEFVATSGALFPWRENYFDLSSAASSNYLTAADMTLIKPDSLCFTKEGDRLRMTLAYRPVCTYRLVLTQSGTPVTGAEIYEIRGSAEQGMPLRETAPGVYEGEQRTYSHLNVHFPDGTAREIFACDDNWRRTGHDYTFSYDLDTPVNLIFIMLYSGASAYYDMEEVQSLEILQGDASLTLPDFSVGVGYVKTRSLLLRAKYGETVRIRITYVVTDSISGSAYRQSRIVELNTKTEYDRFAKGEPSYLILSTFPLDE